MKRIIITGATGMIGASLAKYASSLECDVLCIIRPGSSREGNIPKNSFIKILYAELSNFEDIIPHDRYDVFFHFAWDKTFGSSRNDVDIQLRNIQYTLNAVRLAYRFGCSVFIGAGTQAEYGIVNSDLRSDTPVNPLSGYGIAKYTAGKLSGILCSQLKMRQNWIRFLSVYGTLDSSYTLIMYTINCLLKKEMPLLSKCDQIWDYLYETDAAKALFAIGHKGIDNKAYPLGSGVGKPLSTYIRTIRDIIDPTLSLGFGEKDYYPHQPMHLCADISELTIDTGWIPEMSFEKGIKEIYEKNKHTHTLL